MLDTIMITEDPIELEKLFHDTVNNFKDRWESKNSPISKSGIYSYAVSTMKYAFPDKFLEEKSKELVEQYNPDK